MRLPKDVRYGERPTLMRLSIGMPDDMNHDLTHPRILQKMVKRRRIRNGPITVSLPTYGLALEKPGNGATGHDEVG
jgi:hypothetical protein